MSYITGTASGYVDLLTILDNYLTATGHCSGLTFEGVGTGRLRNYIGTNSSVAEMITCTATSSTQFSVVGSVSGSLGTATVGTQFTSSVCSFLIQAIGTPFQSGDVFTFSISPKWTRLRFAGCSDSTRRGVSWSSSAGTNVDIFDGLLTTGSVNISMPAWISIDCNVPTVVRSVSLGIFNTANRGPATFQVQHSDDGVTWTTILQRTDDYNWQASTARLFALTNPPAKRFWRVYITATQSGTLDLSSVKFWGGVSGELSWPVDSGLQYGWIAPGLSGDKSIYVIGHSFTDVAADIYNVSFRGVRVIPDLEPNPSYDGGILTATGPATLCLGSLPLQYWIVVNGQRFILITRFNSLYQAAYCGFGKPYATPLEHPYPAIIGGASVSKTQRYSSQASTFSNFYSPTATDASDRGHFVFMPDGAIKAMGARSNNSNECFVWPYSQTGTAVQTETYTANVDGTQTMLPAIIKCLSPVHIWGEFDGVRFSTGFNTAVESVIRDGQIDYMLVSNVFRTGPYDFARIALD